MLLYVLVVAVAAVTPWWLRLEPARSRWAVAAVTALGLGMGVGFVALGALGIGAIAGQDGLAAMETMLPVWLPILIISTTLANRHMFALR
jgi:hypothetical protein